MTPLRLAGVALGGLVALTGVVLAFVWTTCRVYVPRDKCLVLIRKTGTPLPPGQKVAEPGQKGIQRETLGPGRYFFNPLTWDWEEHKLVEISAGDPAKWREYLSEASGDMAIPTLEGEWPQVGILVNKIGKPAPGGSDEVVDEGYQGIQRNVLTPGTYRINPYVYEVRPAPATIVPLGCCGVVTSQLGEMPGTEIVEDISVGPDGKPVRGQRKTVQKMAETGQRGVLRNILQPGIYYLNPYVYKVEIVQVGYNQISQARGKQEDTHITFPSKDGFTISVDVTVVWGRHPEHTAEMIYRFGDIGKVKQIILSQMRSICRNLGSEYESTDFIKGEKREQYQRGVTETLKSVCSQRDIEILIALIHNIEVHGSPTAEAEGNDLKKTIQKGFIALEQDLTKQAQRESAKVRAELETSKVAVDVAREQIVADTRKKTAEIKAEGQKSAQEIDAQRDLEVATIDKQIALLDAEKTRVLGRAKARVEELRNQAEADGKQMLVEAFGTGRAYNLYTFAESFAPESIKLIFAGEGTFWTDLRDAEDAAALKILQEPARTATETSPAPRK
jgi:hypothetical protein